MNQNMNAKPNVSIVLKVRIIKYCVKYAKIILCLQNTYLLL